LATQTTIRLRERPCRFASVQGLSCNAHGVYYENPFTCWCVSVNCWFEQFVRSCRKRCRTTTRRPHRQPTARQQR
jgi:hypothetical protein